MLTHVTQCVTQSQNVNSHNTVCVTIIRC